MYTNLTSIVFFLPPRNGTWGVWLFLRFSVCSVEKTKAFSFSPPQKSAIAFTLLNQIFFSSGNLCFCFFFPPPTFNFRLQSNHDDHKDSKWSAGIFYIIRNWIVWGNFRWEKYEIFSNSQLLFDISGSDFCRLSNPYLKMVRCWRWNEITQ